MAQFGQLFLMACLTLAGSCDAVTFRSLAPSCIAGAVDIPRTVIVRSQTPERIFTRFIIDSFHRHSVSGDEHDTAESIISKQRIGCRAFCRARKPSQLSSRAFGD